MTDAVPAGAKPTDDDGSQPGRHAAGRADLGTGFETGDGTGPITGLVTHLQKWSLHDGPGIRTTVFLKGCPLTCAWCHNPENLSGRPQVVTIESRCLRCGQCRTVCPQRTPTPPGTAADDREPFPGRTPPDCQYCGACLDVCPTGARTLLGQWRTVAGVLGEVLTDRPFYEESGGGLTVSGGEPLSQFEFLRALLEAARAAGVHTAVDTCGFAPGRHLLEVLPLVDLFLYDVKLLDDDRHRAFTGVSNRLILENLQLLDRDGANLWLRIPIIPGVNDGARDLRDLAAFAATLSGVRQVNLLPYHATGRAKFSRVGLPAPLPDLQPPSPECLAAAVRCFWEHGVTAKIGG